MFRLSKEGIEVMLHALSGLDCTVKMRESDIGAETMTVLLVQLELPDGVSISVVNEMVNQIVAAIDVAALNSRFDMASIDGMFLNVQFVIF